jgi:hypothetical protein
MPVHDSDLADSLNKIHHCTMTHKNNSREQWEQELVERQHNLAPADITRRSQFRGSGLPRTAPLPIAVRWRYVWLGAALCVLGIGIGLIFDKPYSLVVGTALGAAGFFVMLSCIRWTAK